MSGESAVGRLIAAAGIHAERIAVESYEAAPLTYADLLAQAGAVAEVLRTEGMGRGDLVAIDLEKSAAYVIALVGVWLAGAAFLPLGPGLPPERRRFILEEARPRGVIGHRPEGKEEEEFNAKTRDRKDAKKEKGGRRSNEQPSSPFCVSASLRLCVDSGGFDPSPDEDLAYVIYTSGSTGSPKGVMVSHRGLPNLFQAQIAAFGLGPGCRALFVLSTSFDASVSDIGTALLSGATLVIEPAERLASAAGLLGALQAKGITHADLPPSLLPAIDPRRLPASLSTVVIGGEPCPPEVVRRWAERVRVVNVYGPTEATVCSSLGACDPRTWTRPLLGRPLPGVRYRVVDGALAAVPDGTAGELTIGGVGVALGYLGRPALTAERFVTIEGERVYRTGDRVVHRPDGEIEFLGRLDRQVKLRGRRIEPEEIEARLASHAGVEGAAVVARPLFGARAPRRLVAFVVPRDPRTEDLEPALRLHLAAALPAWMIPGRFCFVPELPRAPSGKVDLPALEAWSLDRTPAPSTRWTGAAAVLEALWCEALGVDAIAASDEFQGTLGGDSVALVEVAARAEAAGLPLGAERLGSRASFGELVAWMERGEADPRERRTAAALRGDTEREWETARAQGTQGSEEDLRVLAPLAPLRSLVLLTGAAGAFGAHLLAALLARDASPLVCIVRAPDDAAATARVARALARLGHALPVDRVRVLAGDLAAPCFGLEDDAWHRLAGDVATIVHAAARVDGVSPYEALRRDNVEATREVLRLARSGRPKHLHHVSTLSVLSQAERDPGPLDERADLGATRAVLGGYAQSKWAAEHLVRASGVPAAVFRLGLLAPGDHLSRFFRGLRDLGGVPFPRATLELDVTPIDRAAAAVVDRARPHAAETRATFHIAATEPATLEDLLFAARAAGATLADVPHEAWPAYARMRLGSADAAIAYLSLCRCLGDGALARHRGLDLFEATGLRFGGIGGLPAPRETLVQVARGVF